MSDSASALTEAHPSLRRAWIGWLAALATVTIWGIWIVGTRHGVTNTLPPAAMGLLRFSVPVLLLAPILWRIGPFPKGLSLANGIGLLGSGAPFFFVVAMGMQFASAAEIGPLLPGTMPLFVALIGWLVFAQRPGRQQLAGFALIVLGVISIAGHGLFLAQGQAWMGHVLLLTGAGLWGVFTHAYRRSGLSSFEAAAVVGFWSVLIFLPFGAPQLVHALADGLAGEVIVQAVLQGFLSGVAGIGLYGIAVDRLGTARASSLSPLAPTLTALFAIPVLGEMPSLAALFGIGMTTLGVMLASGLLKRTR